MPGGELAVDVGGDGGELDDRLGDPGARLLRDPDAELVELGPVGRRTDHDALAARAVDRLDHQLVEAVHHLLAVLGLAEPPGVDVIEDRLLGEVVADQVGEVGVDELVVGHAVADRVGQRDLPAARGVDEPGAAQQGVAAEVHRVEELVVDAAVDHVHGLQAVGGAHHHPPPAALEVAALDELDAHGARQQGVLEVGAVVDARGQHDHRRVGDACRCGGAQCREQPLGVAGDRPDPVVGERLGERGGDRAAVGHDVRDARRHPDVVLQHPEPALVVADQVDARDVDAYAVGRADAGGLAVVVRRGGHDPSGDHAVGEDLSHVVDVGEERLEGAHPLLHARVDLLPGLHLDDPRHDVEREGPLLAADVEGDALVEVRRLEGLDPGGHVALLEVGERRGQGAVRRACVGAGAVEHLVVGRTGRVLLEQALHAPTLGAIGVGGVASACHGRVSTSAPVSVTSSVCSNCAERRRSWVTTVQPSSHMS